MADNLPLARDQNPRGTAHAAAVERITENESGFERGPWGIKLNANRATAIIICSALGMGIMPVFARGLTDDGLSPAAITFYRNLVGAVLLFGFIKFERKRAAALMWGLAVGASLGLGWTAYITAIEVVPISTAGVIYMSYPMVTVLVAWGLFKQRPRARTIGGALLILIAAAIAVGPELSADGVGAVLLVALLAPLGFGFSIAVLTERMGALSPLERVGIAAVGSTIALAPLMLRLSAAEAIPGKFSSWALVGGIALLTALIPQYLYVTTAPSLGPARAAAAGAVELPMLFFISWIALSEDLTWQQLVAGVLVLSAIVAVPSRPTPGIAVVRRRRRLTPGKFYDS